MIDIFGIQENLITSVFHLSISYVFFLLVSNTFVAPHRSQEPDSEKTNSRQTSACMMIGGGVE